MLGLGLVEECMDILDHQLVEDLEVVGGKLKFHIMYSIYLFNCYKVLDSMLLAMALHLIDLFFGCF